MMVVGVGAQARGESAEAAAPINVIARQAIDDARQAEASGRKREAIEGYKRAYELSGDPSLLFHLGELSREVGNTSAAVRFYRAYLARDRNGKQRAAAEQAVSSLGTDEVGPATTDRLASPPPSPAPAHDTFVPAAPPARPATAATPPSMTEGGTASARPSPTVNLQVPAGPTTTTAAAPGATPSDPPLPRWLAWAGLGVTLALGAGAIYSGLRAARRYDELSNSCGQTSAGCAQTDIDQVKAQALTANLLWAAAGVGALATGVTVYVNTRESGVSGVWRF
jgi:hypothetical protein